MKKAVYIIISFLLTGTQVLAQGPTGHHMPARAWMHMAPAQRAHALERIHAIKVAYLTDKLHFTSEQSANFWPIYDQYEKEMQDTRKKFLQKYRNTNPANADERTSLQYIDDNLDYRQAMLDITRKYNDEFLKVITPQQLAQLFKSEREFKQLLIQQLKENRRRNNNAGNSYDEDKL